MIILSFWRSANIVFHATSHSHHHCTGAQFPRILVNTCYFLLFFESSHPNGYEVIPHYGFYLHFSKLVMCWACFHVLISSHIFFGKMPIQVLYPFLNEVFCFCYCWVSEFLHIFCIFHFSIFFWAFFLPPMNISPISQWMNQNHLGYVVRI